MAILLMPSSAIAWMIYMTGEGAASPYYAGLILVLMFLGAVLEWTFRQSVASVILVWVLFAIACLCSPRPEKASPEYLGLVVNNVAFLVSTGVVIIVGTYFNGIIRINEFVQRCEREKERLARENERMEREEERKQSLAKRIALFGDLAANIQHNIGNWMSSIIAFFDLLDVKPNKADLFDDVDFLRQIRSDINKIRQLKDDLKEHLPKPGEAGLTEPLDINTTIRKILARNQPGLADSSIGIESRFAAELPLLLVYKKPIINLFELLVKFELVWLKDSCVRLATDPDTLKGRAAIRVTWRDHGQTLSEEVLRHLTDPNTKPPEPFEYGLYLSLISLNIETVGGTIEASSPAGGGNQFIIRLPLQPESDQPVSDGP
jgi:signal transduction histidine kinase